MNSLDEIFNHVNCFIDGLWVGEGNNEETEKVLKVFQEMTECQKNKSHYVSTLLQASQQLDKLRASVHSQSLKPFDTRKFENATTDWDCVDSATQFYNSLVADQSTFGNWLTKIDNCLPPVYAPRLPPGDENGDYAEVLQSFHSDQGLISGQEIVKILKVDTGKALIRGQGVALDRQNCSKSDLYTTLKSSIGRRHQSPCVSCTNHDLRCVKTTASREPETPTKTQMLQVWIPLIYLQPLSPSKKLLEQVQDLRQVVLGEWENYLKDTAQAVLNVLFVTFKQWSREQMMNFDYVAIDADMKEGLRAFFRSLEKSLANDWECEIHYELILQQLRILQSNETVTNAGQEEVVKQEITERHIGRLLLEKRIIYKLLEKHQEMLKNFEEAKQGHSQEPLCDKCLISSAELLNQRSGCEIEPQDDDKRGSLPSLFAATPYRATPDPTPTRMISQASRLSPPPAFAPQTPPKAAPDVTRDFNTNILDKQFESEPCINETAEKQSPEPQQQQQRQRRHQQNQYQSSGGRYRSADPSIKSTDRRSQLRARSFGKGSKSLPCDTYPLPARVPSPKQQLADLLDAKPMTEKQSSSLQHGYVIIMQPSFRERITTVLDTMRRKRVSIHAAIERGMAGFEGISSEEEHQLGEEEGKKLFFVFDTLVKEKLNFTDALKRGIIHFDSSNTKDTNFEEYVKSEWQGKQLNYCPLVYRVDQVRQVVERNGKLIRQKQNSVSFQQAVSLGLIEKETAEFIIRIDGVEVQRMPFTRALAYGLVKVVPLRHCLIEKLPKENCIFA